MSDRSFEIINPLLEQIGKECDSLKEFIETKDFPYHKSYYYRRVVKHVSAMLLLAGEIKALHALSVLDTQEEIINSLLNCKDE